MTQKQYALGVDIGGTKIAAHLYEILPGGTVSETPVAELKRDTAQGLTTHLEQMQQLFAESVIAADALGGTVASIGVGSPGRFRDGIILPETATNLGPSEGPDSFNNVNLQQHYLKILEGTELANVPVLVRNDGDMMFAGILQALHAASTESFQQDFGTDAPKEALANKRIALFGIGTGIGHAIADMDGFGKITFVTDGHASKIRLPVDQEDLPTFLKGRDALGPEGMIVYEDGTMRSEDLFRGPAVSAMAGVETGMEIELDNPDHQRAIAFAGKYMARLIEAIVKGDSKGVDAAQEWSADDRQAAAQTGAYIIAGGMGSSPLGRHIMAQAQAELEAMELGDVALYQYLGDNVATRAAAMLAAQEIAQTLPLTAGKTVDEHHSTVERRV